MASFALISFGKLLKNFCACDNSTTFNHASLDIQEKGFLLIDSISKAAPPLRNKVISDDLNCPAVINIFNVTNTTNVNLSASYNPLLIYLYTTYVIVSIILNTLLLANEAFSALSILSINKTKNCVKDV